MWGEALVTHSIEVWRAVVMLGERLPVIVPAVETELPAAEEADDVFVELSRQFPALSRELAEYLAR
jgi:hypothetical protein